MMAEKQCKFCGKTIKLNAIKCRFCHKMLEDELPVEVEHKICPHCGQTVKKSALKCRYCHQFFAADAPANPVAQPHTINTGARRLVVLLVLLVITMGLGLVVMFSCSNNEDSGSQVAANEYVTETVEEKDGFLSAMFDSNVKSRKSFQKLLASAQKPHECYAVLKHYDDVFAACQKRYKNCSDLLKDMRADMKKWADNAKFRSQSEVYEDNTELLGLITRALGCGLEIFVKDYGFNRDSSGNPHIFVVNYYRSFKPEYFFANFEPLMELVQFSKNKSADRDFVIKIFSDQGAQDYYGYSRNFDWQQVLTQAGIIGANGYKNLLACQIRFFKTKSQILIPSDQVQYFEYDSIKYLVFDLRTKHWYRQNVSYCNVTDQQKNSLIDDYCIVDQALWFKYPENLPLVSQRGHIRIELPIPNSPRYARWLPALKGDPDAPELANLKTMLIRQFEAQKLARQKEQAKIEQARQEKIRQEKIRQTKLFAEAQLLFNQNQYDESIKKFKNLAKNNNVKAQLFLGHCYKLGRGVPADEKQAVYWYQLASDNKSPVATHLLSKIYNDSQSALFNQTLGMAKLTQAVKMGYLPAIYDLALINLQKTTNPVIQRQGFELLAVAAGKNYLPAQFLLGRCYEVGVGTIKNLEQALKWYRSAAAGGIAQAQPKVAELEKLIQSHERLLNKARTYWNARLYNSAINVLSPVAESGYLPAQLYLAKILRDKAAKKIDKGIVKKWNYIATQHNDVEAMNKMGDLACEEKKYSEALNWYKKSAAGGNDEALNSIGEIYTRGNGVTQNYAWAYKYFSQAAEKNNKNAIANLGWLYANGYGVRANNRKAFEYFYKAAQLGHARAINNCAWMYRNGRGVRQNYRKAYDLYYKAAQMDDNLAQHNLANCYYSGTGTIRNLNWAFKWYRRAAENDNPDSNLLLGQWYENGKHVSRDFATAFKYYKRAAELGNAEAQNSLGVFYIKGLGVKRNYKEGVKWIKKSAAQGFDKAINNMNYIREND